LKRNEGRDRARGEAVEKPTPQQIEIYRRMTPEQKIRAAMRLGASALRFKAAGLRAQHPDWDERRIEARARELFRHART